jgi:hypothetical protein
MALRGIAGAAPFVLALLVAGRAEAAKPRPETKDEGARRVEQKAMQVYVAGDVKAAEQALERTVKGCRGVCSAKTRAHLHVSLGTVKGAGGGDYGAAEKEFTLALGLDPEARLTPALSNAELNAAFERARTAAGATKPPADEEPAEKAPDKPVTVSDLLHTEEEPAPPPKQAPPPSKPEGPEPFYNWFSARAIVDFPLLTDANICSPGAPSAYYCTDASGARYGGRPQPNDDIQPGFAFGNTRLVLGYERLLFAGLTAGAFAGYAFSFAKTPDGRKGGFPLHLEGKVTYTFGQGPFLATGPRLHPFVSLSVGAMEVDSSVIIRVNEIPCQSRIAPACKQDLDVHRRVGGLFTTLGGGARYRIDGPHALRLGVRTSIIWSDGSFVVSPELAYELGI